MNAFVSWTSTAISRRPRTVHASGDTLSVRRESRGLVGLVVRPLVRVPGGTGAPFVASDRWRDAGFGGSGVFDLPIGFVFDLRVNLLPGNMFVSPVPGQQIRLLHQ